MSGTGRGRPAVHDDRLRELGRGGEAVGRYPLESLGDGLVQHLGHGRPRGAERRRGLGEAPGDHALGRRAGERLRPGQHLVQHAAQAVDVAPAVRLGLARGLLRAHVGRRAHRDARLGEVLPACHADRLRDPEVGDQRFALVQHHVLGLDIAVHHPMPMRIVERGRHVPRDLQGVLDRQLLLPIESLTQRLALDVGHDIIEEIASLAGVVQWDDVRMVEPCRDLDLAEKPLGSQGGGQFGMQNLESDEPVVLDIPGQEDGRHAAATELPLERVAVLESSNESRGRERHGRDRESGVPRICTRRGAVASVEFS